MLHCLKKESLIESLFIKYYYHLQACVSGIVLSSGLHPVV